MEELAADALSAMVDADPFGALISMTRFWDAGVVKDAILDMCAGRFACIHWGLYDSSSATVKRGGISAVILPTPALTFEATTGRCSMEICPL